MEEIKNKILLQVAELYLKYGIRSVSMDDLAHELGISKKTIYQYFEDKDDFVNQVTTMLLEERMQEYRHNSEIACNAIEELYTMSRLLRKHFREINPALMYDVQKYHPKAWELFLKHENEVVYDSIMDNLESGIKEGYFRPEIDAKVLARIRVEQIHVSFDERLFPKDQFDFTEVQVQLFSHYVHGLLTESGLELYKNYQNQNNE
jgi:AcrR family transcriptional regulator